MIEIFFETSKLKMNLRALVIGNGSLFLKYAKPIPRRIRFVIIRGAARAPISHGFTGESSMGLNVLTINAGNTTETKLINTMLIVNRKIIQRMIIVPSRSWILLDNLLSY